MSASEHSLDARRLLCPMPVIKTQNLIKTLKPGDKLTVLATDPGVKQDIPAWCRINGHQLDRIEEKDKEFQLFITVGDS